MNQILVTEKLYITPELKRKKKIYKFICMLSLFMIIVLISFYIYAEYDKSKNENISQEILADMTLDEVTEENDDSNDIWEIIIATAEGQEEEKDSSGETYGTYKASDGTTYETIGTITIPSIDLEYPILSETTTALLKVAPCKFWGPEPNEVGNLCIAGHNYRSDKFFSNVPNLVVGDIIEITDLSGRTLKYSVYDKYTVVPEDTSCTSQETDGKKIVTLITCTDDNEKRVIVQAKEIT